MSELIPTEAQKAIASKYSLAGEWVLAPDQGRIHQTYFAGNAVVKIPHDDPDCICDTYTESVAATAAFRAEIRTPRVIAFDDTKQELPVPYLIFERFEGSSCPERLGPELAVKLGREIGRVQATVKDCPDPNNWLDEVPGEDLESEWRLYSMTKEFFMEAPKRPAVIDAILESPLETATVFTHNDVHHKNILIGKSGEICLIDWGDAGWGKPSADFGVLDPLDLEDCLTGYVEWMPVTTELRAGIMREQFGHVFRHFNEGLASGALSEGSKASRAVMRVAKLLKFDCMGFMKGHNS